MVVTVPVGWSYRAQNSTFKALRTAGFNETTFPNLNDFLVISEPQAAAIYTARHLKEDQRKEFLNLGDCFVLCDAGGGTVDCVSYKVTQLEPILELEEFTIATSGKCGSSYIDSNFKDFLKAKINARNYSMLDRQNSRTIEASEMRQLIRRFTEKKMVFSRAHRGTDIHLDLPAPLQTLDIPGRVVQGDLTITHEEMKQIFLPCIERVVELVLEQTMQVERKRNRVRNVFLVGGFGESPFLQEELKHSLRLRKIALRQPERQNAWTAVVQGAVIYGVEKSHHDSLRRMRRCTKSYGLVPRQEHHHNKNYAVMTVQEQQYPNADNLIDESKMRSGRLTWVIRGGDLMLSESSRVETTTISLSFPEGDQSSRSHRQTSSRRVRQRDSRTFRVPIYVYLHNDDDPPHDLATGLHDVREIASLPCDMAAIPDDEFDCLRDPETQMPYFMACLLCKFTMTDESLVIQALWGKKIIGTVTVSNAGEV